MRHGAAIARRLTIAETQSRKVDRPTQSVCRCAVRVTVAVLDADLLCVNVSGVSLSIAPSERTRWLISIVFLDVDSKVHPRNIGHVSLLFIPKNTKEVEVRFVIILYTRLNIPFLRSSPLY